MQFFYTPRGRHLPDNLLLADLRRVAKRVGSRSLTAEQYRTHGRYHMGSALRFGSWNNAITKAGLRAINRTKKTIPEIIADIRRVAGQLKVTCLTGTDYLKHGTCNRTAITREFGGWYNAVTAAGLSMPARYRTPTNIELFENLETMWSILNRQPRAADFIPPLSKFSIGPYVNRFGTFHHTLVAFTRFIARRSTAPKISKTATDLGKKGLHRTGRGISTKLRFTVLERDHFRCCACGQSPANDPSVQLQVDHIHPWSRGGETVLGNLQTLCQACNAGKRDQVAMRSV